MDIEKSTRHSKIVGNFGEQFVANWLSRSGWEVALVDHTGIDIVAFDSKNPDKRIGITVKSRTRDAGTENSPVYILKKNNGDRKKVMATCKGFACEPWVAVYVETDNKSDLYLTSLAHYDMAYRGTCAKATDDWKMTDTDQHKYKSDPEVHHLHNEITESNWNNLRCQA